MGFRLDRSYKLTFEESALEGAEVRLRSTPVGVMLKFMEDVSFEDAAKLLAEYLIDWNLENAEGQPIETTPEAMMASLEKVVLDRIIREWMRAARGVTAPLEPPSNSGEQLVAASIPMETL